MDYLTLRSFAPMGLPEQFASGRITGADFKASQMFAERTFREQQKELERFCDWTFRRWHETAVKHGTIKALTDEQIDSISWDWPSQSSLDRVSDANATRLELENCTLSYKELLGNNWQSKLLQIKAEQDWARENKVLLPTWKLISGGESQMISVDDDAKN